MKKLNLSFGDGFPLEQETLTFMQDSYLEALTALGKTVGDNVILSGCDVSGNVLSDGWVVYQNEITPVRGTTKATGQIFAYSLVPNTGLQTYQNGNLYPSYSDKYISVNGGSSGANFVTDFKRLNTFKVVDGKVITLETNYNSVSTDLVGLDSRLDVIEAYNLSSALSIIRGRLDALEAKNLFKIMHRGTKTFDDIDNGTDGLLLHIAFGTILPHNQYCILGTMYTGAVDALGTGNLSWISCNHTTSGCSIRITESNNSTQPVSYFRYYVVEMASL